MHQPYTFCHVCGTKYPQLQHPAVTWLRKDCKNCGATWWYNPTPIAVLLQPVFKFVADLGRPRIQWGLLAGRRAINPCIGEWALPGGFVTTDPSYESAALRETEEEITFKDNRYAQIVEAGAKLLWSKQGDRGQILAFCKAHPIPHHWLQDFIPNHECDAVKVLWQTEPLCFSSHTASVVEWFLNNEFERLENLLYGWPPYRDEYGITELEIKEQQRLCQHTWQHEPDLYDYHKREEYHRCTKCHKVV